MKIRKNDNVIVLAGKDKGKKGKVLKVFPNKNKVVVEGVHVAKRHNKSRKRDKKGEIVEFSAPIDVSNVSLLDPKSGKKTRVGFVIDNGKKVRIAKKSGQKID